MEYFVSIGERLREVRERLGKTQSDFADIAASAGVPGATRQSQAKYEKGLSSPSAAYLSAIAAAGADVLYILTGQPIAEATSAAAQGIDAVRLAIAIEAVEEGLEETRRRISPKKKAELVMAAYELINQTSQSRDNVIRLVRMAA